jgi:hypothetical protein
LLDSTNLKGMNLKLLGLITQDPEHLCSNASKIIAPSRCFKKENKNVFKHDYVL